MKAHTKITLKELIARKEQMLEAKRTPKRQDLFVKSLDGVITIEEPSRAIVIEAQEMGTDVSDAYMVYQCTVEPNLKDTELHKEFGCVEPLEIVDKIFSGGEVVNISKQCLELGGYVDGVSVADTLKN